VGNPGTNARAGAVLLLSENFAGADGRTAWRAVTIRMSTFELRDTLYSGLGRWVRAKREARGGKCFGVVQHNDIKRWRR